jgi:hypothetical protein
MRLGGTRCRTSLYRRLRGNRLLFEGWLLQLLYCPVWCQRVGIRYLERIEVAQVRLTKATRRTEKATQTVMVASFAPWA